MPGWNPSAWVGCWIWGWDSEHRGASSNRITAFVFHAELQAGRQSIGRLLMFAGQSSAGMMRQIVIRLPLIIRFIVIARQERHRAVQPVGYFAKSNNLSRLGADTAFVAPMHWLPIACFVAPQCFCGMLPDPLRARLSAVGTFGVSGRGGQSVGGVGPPAWRNLCDQWRCNVPGRLTNVIQHWCVLVRDPTVM